MASKWVVTTNPRVQGGLISVSESLSGDYPNIVFRFELYSQWWNEYNHAQTYNSVTFKYWVTYYEYWTTTSRVDYSVSSGYSPEYARATWNAPLGDSQQVSQDCYVYVTGCLFPYESGCLTITSPLIERPSNLKITISNITATTCTVNYSYTNQRNYWRVMVWDVGRKIYVTGYLTGSGSATVTGLSPNTTYTFELWAFDRKGTALYENTYYTAPAFTTPKPPAPTAGKVSISNITTTGATVTLSGWSFGEGATWGYYEYRMATSVGVFGWLSVGSSTTFNVTLAPGTSCTVYVRLVDNTGTASAEVASDKFTTLIDQVTVPIKVGGVWKTGKVFTKVNGTWQKGKKAYIKSGSTWKEKK